MSMQATVEWFLTAKGEKLGPVSMEELREFARLGGIHPREDMVWKAGMAEWVAAGEVDGLFERRKEENLVGSSGMAATVTSAGSDVWEREVGDPHHREVARPWPGVGRMALFMGVAVIPTAGMFGLSLLAPLAANVVGPEIAQYVPFLGLGFLVIALYATVERFPNLGMSRWWALGLCVPLLNWWVGYRCFACPPGYAFNQRLDVAGWVLAVLYWLNLAANLAFLVVMVVMFGAALLDPEAMAGLLEQLGAQAVLPK